MSRLGRWASRHGCQQGWTALLALFCMGCLLLPGEWGWLSPVKAATLGKTQDQPQVVLQIQQKPLIPLSAGNRPAATVGVACTPRLNSYDRTHLCWEARLTFTFWEGKQPVGTLTVILVQTMTLNPRSTSWEEQDWVTQVVSRGVTAPVSVRLEATCGQSYQVTARLQGVIRVGLKSTVAYEFSSLRRARSTVP